MVGGNFLPLAHDCRIKAVRHKVVLGDRYTCMLIQSEESFYNVVVFFHNQLNSAVK